MTLIDTSAWVEFLRATGSAAHHRVRDIINEHEPLHTTDVVMMEVLAGGRDEGHTTKLRRLLGRCDFVPVAGLIDFEAGAAIYRTCRRRGETIRSVNDCLVAAISIREQLDVLHSDRDFEAIARHTPLLVAKV